MTLDKLQQANEVSDAIDRLKSRINKLETHPKKVFLSLGDGFWIANHDLKCFDQITSLALEELREQLTSLEERFKSL